jgi:hypothetical protein
MLSITSTSITTALAVLLLTTNNSNVLAYVNTAPTATTSVGIAPSQGRSLLPTNQVAAGTAGAWRIALNIGNNPSTGVSSTSWPILVKCDFSDKHNQVIPQQPDVRYTIQTGEVVKPVEAGAWSLQSKNKGNKNQNLAFTLNFPEPMSRNDLKLDAGSITCEGLLYTQDDVRLLNDNFYRARDRTWEVGSQLNDMGQKRDAPKKWNDDTQAWEKRHANEPVWSYLAKRAQHMKLQNLERQEQAKRPDPKTVSAQSGYFPGFEEGQQVFIGKMGVIKQGMKVIGTWSAEPINGRPVSYVGN